MPAEIITCALCGAHCLASTATEYQYDGETRKACPRCWRGIVEHSDVPEAPSA